jgi:hypothetical protein
VPRLLPLIGLLPLVLGGCGGLGCGDEVVQREPRPDARGAAVVFVRDCAMTGPSTRVALLRNLDAPPRAGELLFVADADRGDAEVRIRWMNVDHLEIAHDPRTRSTRRTPVQRDLRITYAPREDRA